MRAYTTTVNMNQAELKAWVANPRNLLASTATGHESLRRLAEGDHFQDPTFARKADNFNTRHMLSGYLFGQEVGKSGWSKRHIALKNWGHDPSKQGSPLHDVDQMWLQAHSGAETRRKGRTPNPVVITTIECPSADIGVLMELAPFLAFEERPAVRSSGRGYKQIEYVPEDCLLGEGEVYSDVPFGDYHMRLGLLKDGYSPSISRSGSKVGKDAFHKIASSVPESACLWQIEPALTHSLGSRYDRFIRVPNPTFGAWILPIAQLLVSGSGLFYSVSNLASLVSASRQPAQQQPAGDEIIEDAGNLVPRPRTLPRRS